jgi:hypothetical protein
MLIHPSELASLIGGVLTLAGVVLTAIQLLRKSGRFNLTLAATLPGLVLVGFGVILLVVGAQTASVTPP